MKRSFRIDNLWFVVSLVVLRLVGQAGAVPGRIAALKLGKARNHAMFRKNVTARMFLTALAALLALALGTVNALAGDGSWSGQSGNWSDTTKWVDTDIPADGVGNIADGVGATALFTLGGLTSNRSFTIDNTSRTLGTLTLGENRSCHINATGGAVLILDNNGSPSQVTLTTGAGNNFYIDVAFELNGDLNITNERYTDSAKHLNFGTITNISSGNVTITNNVGTQTNGGTVNFLGVVSDGTNGTVSLYADNKGTAAIYALSLAAANTYSGSTTLTSGYLNLQNANAIQNSTLIMNGGNLIMNSLGGTAFNFGGLSATTNGVGYDIALTNSASAAVALSVGNNNDDTAYAGVLSAGGSLTKVGNGTLTLTGASTYTGLTTISNGVLRWLNDDSGNYGGFWYQARAYTIASGAVMQLEGVRISDLDQYIPIGTTTIGGAGTLRITNCALYSYEAGDYLNLSLGSGGLIDVQAGGGELWNGWSWDDLGDGTDNSITWTENLASLNVDGLFDVWNGNDVFVDALTGGGTVQRTKSGRVITLTVGVNNGSGTFTGTITNGAETAVAFTKTGSGTQTLSGSNSYTGVTTVTEGTLQLNGVDATTDPVAWDPVLNVGGADIQGQGNVGVYSKMVFDYTGGSSPGPTIAGLLDYSYHGDLYGVGLWDQGKFLSTTAVATGLTLGWTDSGTQVTVMATYAGDANLDGEVDGADVDIWKLNVGTTGSGVWELADFNYDGEVDGADVDIWKLKVGSSLAPPPGGAGLSASIVPEPGTLALLAAALAALAGWMIRRRK
jgi:autotransporter-associated beta strand protein